MENDTWDPLLIDFLNQNIRNWLRESRIVDITLLLEQLGSSLEGSPILAAGGSPAAIGVELHSGTAAEES